MPTPEHHTSNGVALVATASLLFANFPWSVVIAGGAGSILGVTLAGSMPYRRGLLMVLFGIVIGYYAHLLLVDYWGFHIPTATGFTFFLMAAAIAFKDLIMDVIKTRISAFRAKQ